MRIQLSEIRASLTFDEMRVAAPLLLKTILPICALFILLQLALGGEVVGKLTRDPNAVSKAPFYVGFISMLGISLWMASALMTFIGASLAPRDSAERRLLYGFGLFAGLLSLDDMLQLHEQVLPFYLGIPEVLTYLFYALLAMFLVARHFSVLIRNEPIVFGASIAFMGLSVLADTVPSHVPILGIFGSFAFEDGCKFAGIVLWTVYFSRYALRLARGGTR